VGTEPIEFLVNNVKADIVDKTDSTLTIVVPEKSSTGGVRLTVGNNIFPGPVVAINGRLSVDSSFVTGTGINGFLQVIKKLNNGQYLLGGSFNNYNGKAAQNPMDGLIKVDVNGELITGQQFGLGLHGGSVSAINVLPGAQQGMLLIAGSFKEYAFSNLTFNMTKIQDNGALVVQEVEILNLSEDPSRNKILVPEFNGGTDYGIKRSFVHNNKVTVLGNFYGYRSIFYRGSTVDNILNDLFKMNQVVRMDLNGALDSTYYVNHTSFPKEGFKGLNGAVYDGAMNTAGQLLLVGSFTTFNGANISNNIVRLNESGQVDETFKAGTGADGAILFSKLLSNGKYLLTGRFNNFNGFQSNGIVVLHADGSVDQSFKSLGFSRGSATYATQLSNGLYLVTGSFETYNNVIREGLLVLNPDGTLAEGYNNTGKLNGLVYDSLEEVIAGKHSITLVGLFSSFNASSHGNLVRINISN